MKSYIHWITKQEHTPLGQPQTKVQNTKIRIFQPTYNLFYPPTIQFIVLDERRVQVKQYKD